MRKHKRKIAYVTGTRADFGIVTPLLKKLAHHPKFELHLYATGMHLMPEFGSSIQVVQSEFPTVQKISTIFEKSDPASMVSFGGGLMTHLSELFSRNRPDIVLVHGDRIEMLMVAVAASYFGIPIVHTQGGDLSQTIDDTIRHTISKLAHLHFPATPHAQQVLLNLGEEK